MKTLKRTYRMFMLLGILALLFTSAAAPMQEAGADPWTGLIAEAFALLGLGAVGAVPSALINAGKKLGFVKDGDAKSWVAGLSVLFIGAGYYFQLISPDQFALLTPQILGASDLVVKVSGFVIEFLVIIGGAGIAHNKFLKGVGVVGYSHQ